MVSICFYMVLHGFIALAQIFASALRALRQALSRCTFVTLPPWITPQDPCPGMLHDLLAADNIAGNRNVELRPELSGVFYALSQLCLRTGAVSPLT